MAPSSSLRVLQLNKRYWPHPGGIERYVRDLSVQAAQRPDVSVSALVCSPTSSTQTTLLDGVRVQQVGSYGTLWSLPLSPGYSAALRQALAQGVSVAHLHEPFPLGVWAWLLYQRGHAQSGQGGTPLVVTWHSDILRQRAVLPIYAPMVRRVLAEANAVIVPTERHITASQFLPAVAEKCHVIPFGVPIVRYASPQAQLAGAALRAKLGGGPLVLFVGRLVYYKGLPHLVRAMQQVPATLVLVGEGSDRAALEQLAREDGVAERVRFVGSVDDDALPAYYQACDLFVLPSTAITEGFGIVQLEAMAAGKPVITTALPTGVATVNLHNETGLVVPPGQPDALAAAITQLLGDPELAHHLGAQATARVTAHYSLEQMVDATLALYRQVIEPNDGH